MYDAALRKYLLHPQQAQHAASTKPTLKTLNFPTERERHDIYETNITHHAARLAIWDVIGKTPLKPDSPLYVKSTDRTFLPVDKKQIELIPMLRLTLTLTLFLWFFFSFLFLVSFLLVYAAIRRCRSSAKK